MTHFEISSILTIVSTGLIAILFALKDNRRPVDRQYAIYLAAICAWAFGWFKMISSDFATSLRWARLLHFPAVFIPATFLHFSQEFLGLRDPRSRRFLNILYATACIFLLPVFYGRYVVTVIPTPGFRFYAKHGPIYIVFVAYFFVCLLITFKLLVREFILAAGSRRKSIGVLLLAYAVGYTGGASVFLPDVNLPIPWFSLYGITLCHLIILYAITRHRWLNVGLLARRVGVIAVIYAGLILGVAPFVLTLHETTQSLIGVSLGNLALEVLLLSVVLSAGPFIYLAILRRAQWLRVHQTKGLTHELRSPLDAIQSAVEIVLEEIEENPNGTKQIREYVRMIDKNVARINNLVGNLLSIAKIEDEAVAINRREVDLKRAIFETIEHLRAQNFREEISVASLDGNCVIVGDEDKIKQVISNVLGNAVKFAPKGEISVTLGFKNGHVECSIRDTGSGIPADDIPRIFDHYHQGKNACRGAGLGLSISKAWVEAHGGRIWAESEGEGKGTTVTFTLPAN